MACECLARVTRSRPTTACVRGRQSIVVDLALVIEAREAERLPERILGAVRMQRIHLGKY